MVIKGEEVTPTLDGAAGNERPEILRRESTTGFYWSFVNSLALANGLAALVMPCGVAARWLAIERAAIRLQVISIRRNGTAAAFNGRRHAALASVSV